MFFIIKEDSNPHHLLTLHAWFIKEWGHIDPFETAIVAVDNEQPAAGLVFSHYPKPGSKELGLWINALYVTTEYRKKGIASLLIKAAEAEALKKNAEELYAYTHLPELYLKMGWLIVEDEGDHKVLKKTLQQCPK